VFFAICAFISLAVGAGLFIPVLAGYIQTGLVARFPTLIVSTLFLLVSGILGGCGLILDTLRKQHKQSFEWRLHDIAFQYRQLRGKRDDQHT